MINGNLKTWISVILFIVAQTMGLTWFMASLDARVAALEYRTDREIKLILERLNARVERLEEGQR